MTLWLLLLLLKVKNDHRSKFSNLSNWKEEAWKIKASTGFEPVTSAIPVRCSINWALLSLIIYSVIAIIAVIAIINHYCYNCHHCHYHCCYCLHSIFTLSCLSQISFRPLILSNFSDNLSSLFILNILSVPGLMLHLSSVAPDVSLVTFA